MNQNEMLEGGEKRLTFTCVLVCVSGWLGDSLRIQF